MKNIAKYILGIVLVLGFTACEKKEFTDSIFVDKAKDTTIYTYQFDQWLYEHFTVPYNVEFIYKLDDAAMDPNYNVVPVSIGKADTLAHLALYLWYDVYDQVVDSSFLRTYGPKMLQVVGSAMINADQGTEKLGYAEGGIKITILKVNKMETDNIDQLNEYVFKTMHHEFSHILHQQKQYPKDFEQITPADYDPSGWQHRSLEEAAALGYVSAYASKETHEDFVETIANYIVLPQNDWDYILFCAGEKQDKILQKLEMCRTWLRDKWEIDLDAMRAEVQKRQSHMDFEKIMRCDFSVDD